jgi:hypothetical protein
MRPASPLLGPVVEGQPLNNAIVATFTDPRPSAASAFITGTVSKKEGHKRS